HIAFLERDVARRSLPVLEHAYDAARRLQRFDPTVAAKQKRRRMTAIDEAQRTRAIVIGTKEESGIRGRRSALLKQLVHRREQTWNIAGVRGKLPAHMRLQVGNQQRSA